MSAALPSDGQTCNRCWPYVKRENGKRRGVEPASLLGEMENSLQIAVTPLQYASAGASPPTTLLTLLDAKVFFVCIARQQAAMQPGNQSERF